MRRVSYQIERDRAKNTLRHFQVSCCGTYTAIPKKDFLKIPYFFVFRFFEVTWHVVFDPEAGVDRTEVTTTPLRRDPTYIR